MRTHQRTRVENGLAPLHIIEVAHLTDIAGDIISSSRIRNGLVDVEGHPWFSPAWEGQVLRMHPRAEPELKTPMGVLYEGPETAPEVAMLAALEDIDTSQTILIAVGDVTVSTLWRSISFRLGIYRRANQTHSLSKRRAGGLFSLYPCSGSIQPCRRADARTQGGHCPGSQLEEPTVVVVDGEEDLAPLYIHLHVPLHAVVFYGQPGVGVVAQPSSLETKARCRRLLELFEVV